MAEAERAAVVGLPVRAAAVVFELLAADRDGPQLVVVPSESEVLAWTEAAGLLRGPGRARLIPFPSPALTPYQQAEASLLERDYAAYQEARFCLACTSGGTAIQIALRAAGVRPGDKLLANAFTLAPVPGAMHAVGARPVLVEIDENLVTDLDDLERKARDSGARFFLISHMRGHIADMDAVVALCRERDIVLIEDFSSRRLLITRRTVTVAFDIRTWP